MNKLELYQIKNGYRYNSDTLFFFDFLSSYLKHGKILDVGSGCGILGLLIKKFFPDTELTLLDFQEENAKLSTKNAQKNTLDVRVKNEDFLNFYEENYDFIISNPPFYHRNVLKSQNEHLSKSRYSDFLPFDKFAKKAYELLEKKGRFCFCYDAKQLLNIMSELKKNNFAVEFMRFVHTRKNSQANLVFIVAKKDFKGLCEIISPLFVHEDDKFSKEAREIFNKTNTISLDEDN